jgi:penicillin-binding protein 1A
MPRPGQATSHARKPAVTMTGPRGVIVARFGSVTGRPVRLGQLPPYVPEAFTAIEDRRFWQHGPFDGEGLLRAALLDILRRHVVQGGSTITQQVAKTLFLSNRRTVTRKFREAVLSEWLWHHYSQQQILEIYLNRVYLGAGAYGVDAAAELYFGIPARRLAIWQAAVLAGLPRAPSAFNPLVNPHAATLRARQVLKAMVETGAITQQTALAEAAAIIFPPRPTMGASWFALWALQQAGTAVPRNEDTRLAVTLDPRLQRAAETALDREVTANAASNVHQGAVVVLSAATGAVLAMVGGVGDREGYNRAVLARRQTGSTFKPIVWLAALQAGLTPDSVIDDAPVDIHGYRPHDYESRYLGPVSMAKGLALSLNTVAVRLLLRAGGPARVIALARRLGLDDHLPHNATLALGAGSVGVLQLAAAYAPFFNGGARIVPFGVTAVTAEGLTHRLIRRHATPVVSRQDATAMMDMLRGVVTGGTGTAAFIPGLFTAGKTGTSNGFRDAWFVGYARGNIIAVWVGNDDNAPMRRIAGGSLPARIFRDIAAVHPS